MGYEYKETDLTDEQYKALSPSFGKMELAVLTDSVQKGDGAPDAGFLEYCADLHLVLFSGPRPNIRHGVGILYMFKQILKKKDKYELKRTAEATRPIHIRPTLDKTKNRGSVG